MLGGAISALNGSGAVVRAVALAFPDDELIEACAVTALETEGMAPVGWSLRRLGQRRAVWVVTNARSVVAAPLFTPLGLIWSGIFAFSLLAALGGDPIRGVLMLPAAVFLWQHRPFRRVLVHGEVEVDLSGVTSVSGRHPLVALHHRGRTLHLVPATAVSAPVLEALS